MLIFPTTDTPPNTFQLWFERISEHGVMILFLYIDFILNDIRFYKRHVTFLLFTMGFYAIVNYIVSMYFGPVYKVLDWSGITTYLYLCLAALLGVGHYFWGVLLYQFLKKKRIERIRY